jgi:short-subunit dehydrogenase
VSGESWLILGASSAIARAFAREAAARGDVVLLAGRDQEDMATTACDLEVRHGIETHVLLFDATAYDSHDAFLDRVAERRRGQLNVFLAFAAMAEQSELASDTARELDIAETTYLAPLSMLSRLARVLEADGAGRLVVLGSVAGDRGRPKNYAYGSAKAGLHAYLQGLRSRLWKKGVTVTTIKPGFVDTAMTWGLEGLFLVASPEAAARAAMRHALNGAEVRYVPAFWWLIMSLIKAVPERLFKRLDF